MKDWRERLRDLYLEENSEITSPNSILFNWGEFLFKGKAYQNFYLATQDSIEEFIEQEIDKAEKRGYRRGLEENLEKRNSEGGLTILESLMLSKLKDNK